MKKVLYGTTALAAAAVVAAGVTGEAVAQERIKLNISGYSQFWMVGLDQDFNDNAPNRNVQGFHNSAIDFKQNAEVCFTGSTTLDNGITVGVQVQLEANGEIGGQNPIDESFIFVESDKFGRLVLGAQDSASENLHVLAPNGGMSIDGDGDVSGNSFYIDTIGIAANDTIPEFTGDDTKATYLTPQLFGFQAGVSYTPQNTGFGQRNPNYKSAGKFYHDAVSGALAYNAVYSNGFGVALSGGLEWASGTGNFDALGFDKNYFTVGGGAQFSFAGFTLGGAYNNENGPTDFGVPAGGGVSLSAATDFQIFDRSTWSVGLSYETGPYKAGVEYASTTAPGANVAGSGDRERQTLGVSGTYLLGPGIRLIGGVFLFDQEAESSISGTGIPIGGNTTADQSDSDGFGGTIALTTSF